jgi:hypothetical protein
VDAGIRRYAARFGIDRDDGLLQKAHAWLLDLAVQETDVVRRLPSEHHVELRVPKDERVALVDQGNVDLCGDGFRQHRCELETSEAGTQDEDWLHRAILLPFLRPIPQRCKQSRRLPWAGAGGQRCEQRQQTQHRSG